MASVCTTAFKAQGLLFVPLLKTQWLLYLQPLKRSGCCMYHRLESAVVAVCTARLKHSVCSVYHSFKAQWLLYVPPRLKHSLFSVYTTSFKAQWLLYVPPRLKHSLFSVYTTSFKAQWLLYVPLRVTFGSLIHISPAQYRRTCLWSSYDSRNLRVRQYIDPPVRVMNVLCGEGRLLPCLPES